MSEEPAQRPGRQDADQQPAHDRADHLSALVGSGQARGKRDDDLRDHRHRAHSDQRRRQHGEARGRRARGRRGRVAAAQHDGAIATEPDAAHMLFLVLALADWWFAVPQLARMITGHKTQSPAEHARRRAAVVQAARRLARDLDTTPSHRTAPAIKIRPDQ